MESSETSSPTLTVGVAAETFPGERRVALVPSSVSKLRKAGIAVCFEPGAGKQAGFSDDQYTAQGATAAADRDALFARSDVVLQVRAAGANPHESGAASRLRNGQVLVASCDPLSEPAALKAVAQTGATCFALELLPRITRAQSMDVLSSMATIAGYKAVLLAAGTLPRMFPMMMTAAGTVTPARVFVVGAGVAGLQAIATARRLGAVVNAYDVRPAVAEQIESLGGKFVTFNVETADAETKGGYAREMDEEFYQQQREFMAGVVAESDVVITTAAIPGKPSPLLITAEAVRGMPAGSMIVDLAAERGGNCELTVAGETVNENGVTIAGPTNLPSTVPYHASEMYSRNVTTFVLSLVKDGKLHIDLDDEVVRDTLTTRDGEVVHARIRDLLGLPPIAPPAEKAADGGSKIADGAATDAGESHAHADEEQREVKTDG